MGGRLGRADGRTAPSLVHLSPHGLYLYVRRVSSSERHRSVGAMHKGPAGARFDIYLNRPAIDSELNEEFNCVCVCDRENERARARARACVHVCVRACVCTCTLTGTNTHTRTLSLSHTRTHAHTFTHTHTHTRTHILDDMTTGPKRTFRTGFPAHPI